MAFQQLSRQIDWFNTIGVDSFNFSVLVPPSMLNDKFQRSRTEVLAAAGWAWARNRVGFNVYLRPATGPAWPVLLLDDVLILKAKAIARKYSTLVIETSASNCQVWIATTSSMHVAERVTVQRVLAARINADLGSVSGDHFGRAAGFRNRKPGRGNHLVDIVEESRAELLDARLHLISPPQPIVTRRNVSTTGESDRDESRDEFGWALGWLKSGQPMDVGARRLAEQALIRGKRSTALSASTYATRTFERAKEVLRKTSPVSL